MRTLRTLLAPLALLALSLSACATADDGEPAGQAAADPEHVVVHVNDLPLAPDTGDTDVCNCTDQSCVDEYVQSILGCGVDAIVVCGEQGSVEGFAPCDLQQ
jgi:hypothetical protein